MKVCLPCVLSAASLNEERVEGGDADSFITISDEAGGDVCSVRRVQHGHKYKDLAAPYASHRIAEISHLVGTSFWGPLQTLKDT